MRKKKLGFLAVLVVILIALLVFIGMKAGEDMPKNEPTPSHGKNEKPSETGQDKQPNSEELIKDIFDLSQKGKVPDAPFTSGKTDIKIVHNKWGEPKETTKSGNGHYESYPDHDVTVGFQDNQVFDIRSFNVGLSNIHLNEIKKLMGNPDEVHYYKDETHNQIILVYQVNSAYQLKWILPKPSEQKPDPVVHHTSVYTEEIDHDENPQSASEIIEKMSLDEKIGQMMFAGITGTTINQSTKNLISQYKVGGIILYGENLETPQQTVTLLNDMTAENAKNRLPLFVGTDQEGGSVSRLPGHLIDFPTNKKIGEINQPTFSYEVGTLLGEELNAFGFNLDFAPVLDVNSNPNNPIIGDRSFGNNPEIVSNLGIQTMKGIQSQNVIPVVKHFPGHGDTSVDSHLELPKVNKSLEELNKLELIPFRNAIDNGADVVMVAHILLPKLDENYPATMSKKIITDILRNKLQFDGVVITDDMTMKAITNHFDIGKAAVDSVSAGSDIILVAHDYNKIQSVVDALKNAVKKGEITEERINTSVSRIIQLKRKYKIENKKVSAVNTNEFNEDAKNVLNKYVK